MPELCAVVGAGTVVGEEEDQGVVEFAGLLEVGDQAAEFLVDAVDQCGVGGHAAGFPVADRRGQRVPGRDVVRARGGFDVLAEQVEFPLFGDPRVADLVPAGVIAAEVFFVVLLERLQRRVGCVEGEVEEPRSSRFPRGLRRGT